MMFAATGCTDDSSGLLTGGDTSTSEADTSGADTSGADTSGADTSGADTSGADTSGADTSGADTSGADTSGADTSGADTSGADTDTGDVCDDNPCGPGTCTSAGDGTFTCDCADTGFEGDTCATDIDECAADEDGDGLPDACDPNATCANTEGAFTCTCNAPDYVGDGQTCVVALDCALGETTCDPNAACTDTGNGSFCICGEGFSGDGVTCADIDGCAGAPCFAGVACADVAAPGTGFTCGACPAGYEGDGVTCADTDGCAGAPCFAGVACVDVAAPDTGFTCGACPTGYEGDGVACADIDGCAGAPCFAGVACADVTAPGTGFTCGACPAGYEGDGETCADIDGCAGAPCFAGVACADVTAPGTGFTCGACPAGYEGDGIACADIDGCAGAPCFAGVTCADVAAPGTGFTCGACPTGYSGDGIACADIDECAAGTDTCDANAACANTIGGFTCTCPPGGVDINGDGSVCAFQTSCRTLLAADPTLPNGLYTIDTGTGGLTEVFCDMTTDGGAGYTMLRIDSASLTTGVGSQPAYIAACAALGMEIIVPRTKAHARAIQAYNGGNPNIVNVSPKFDGAVGLSNWTGICQGQPCTFYMDDTNSAGCTNPEPNGDNTTESRLYRRSDEGGCFFGNWNDAATQVGIGGSVLCSTNDASPAPSLTCADALDSEAVYNASSAGISGPYTLDPDADGPLDPFSAYCDMTRDGGGWTLIGKVAAGDYTALTDDDYIALILNPSADVNPALLQDAAAPAAGQIAFLSRPNTNALYAAAATQNLRVDMSNNASDPANNGVYFQARTTPLADGDLWGAIRDSRRWGTGTVDVWVVNPAIDFTLAFGTVYDPATDTFPDATDGTFGWWSLDTFTLNDGTSFTASRHFGLLADGVGNRGWQWLLTADRADTRWKNDPSAQRSLIWIK